MAINIPALISFATTGVSSSRRQVQNLRDDIDDVTDSLDEADSSTNTLGNSLGSLSGVISFAAITAGITQSISAFAQLEADTFRLERSLRQLNGISFNQLNAQITSISDSTGFAEGDLISISDELARVAQAYGKDASTLIQAAADLSTETGESLDQASKRIQDLFKGSIEELGRLYPELIRVKAEGGSTAEVFEALQNSISGAATEFNTGTIQGALQEVRTEIGDTFEEFGKGITGATDLKGVLNSIAESLRYFQGGIQDFFAFWDTGIGKVLLGLGKIVLSIFGIQKALGILKSVLLPTWKLLVGSAKLFNKAITSISLNLSTLFESLTVGIRIFASKMFDGIRALTYKLAKYLLQLGSKIENKFIKFILSRIRQGLANLQSFFIRGMKHLYSQADRFAGLIVSSVGAAFGSLIFKFREWFEAAGKWLYEWIPGIKDIAEGAKQLYNEWQGVNEQIDYSGEAAKRFQDAIGGLKVELDETNTAATKLAREGMKEISDLRISLFGNNQDKELNALDNRFDKLREKYKDNGELLTQIEVLYRRKRQEINAKYDEEEEKRLQESVDKMQETALDKLKLEREYFDEQLEIRKEADEKAKEFEQIQQDAILARIEAEVEAQKEADEARLERQKEANDRWLAEIKRAQKEAQSVIDFGFFTVEADTMKAAIDGASGSIREFSVAAAEHGASIKELVRNMIAGMLKTLQIAAIEFALIASLDAIATALTGRPGLVLGAYYGQKAGGGASSGSFGNFIGNVTGFGLQSGPSEGSIPNFDTFHNGGEITASSGVRLPNFRHDERLIKAQVGETINRKGQGDNGVNVIINTSQPMQMKEQYVTAQGVKEIVIEDIRNNGTINSTLNKYNNSTRRTT